MEYWWLDKDVLKLVSFLLGVLYPSLICLFIEIKLNTTQPISRWSTQA